MVEYNYLASESASFAHSLSGIRGLSKWNAIFFYIAGSKCATQLIFLETLEIFGYLSNHRRFSYVGVALVLEVALCTFLCLCYLLRNTTLWSIVADVCVS